MEWLYSVSPDFLDPFLLPLFIFFARVTDVTVGTLRIVFLTQGRKRLAPLVGVIEVTVWLLAVSSVIQNVTEPLNFIAYVAGYSTGSYMGMIVEERLALGKIILRLVTRKDSSDLIEYFNHHNFGFTSVDAKGKDGKVQIIFLVINRYDLDKIISIINQYNPNAFFSVEDVRRVQEGNYPVLGTPILRK